MPPPASKVTEIPIKSPLPETISTTVPLPQPRESSAAIKIQSAYRSHAIRALVRKISAADRHSPGHQRRRLRFGLQERVEQALVLSGARHLDLHFPVLALHHHPNLFRPCGNSGPRRLLHPELNHWQFIPRHHDGNGQHT